jgi:hypothetical protein
VVDTSVAGSDSGDSSTASRALAVFRLCVSDADGARALTGTEKIEASVVGVPTTVTAGKTLAANSTDIGFVELKYASSADLTDGGIDYTTDSPTAGSFTRAFKTVLSSAQTTQVSILAGRGDATTPSLDGQITAKNTAVSDSGTARVYGSNTCYLMGAHGFSQTAWDQGTYTIRFAMTDASGFLSKVQDVSVKYVTSAADSGATFTITNTGRITDGAVYTFGSTNRTTVTLTNGTTGGRIFAFNSTGGDNTPVCPTLAVAVVDQDGAVLSSSGLLIGDTGTAGLDHVASTSDSATVQYNTLENAFCNGTYGITTNSTSTFATAVTNNATSGNTTAFRVRYGSTSTTAAFTVTTTASATVSDSSVSLTATGSKNHDDAANTGLMNNGNRWTLPLTTKSAVIKVRAMSSATAPVANYPLLFSVSWSSAAAGEVTPRTTSSTIAATSVTTDSSGYASLTLTNNSPIDGASVVVTVTGFTGTAAGQTIVWQKSKPASVTVSGGTGMKAKTGSTNTVTWTYTDTFGAPVAGAVVDLAISGANSATSTVVIPSTTTDANGVASYTFTDAAGVEASTTLGTTTLTATARETSLAGSRIITWVATMPVVATITGFRNDNEATSAPATYPDPVDAGVVIYDTASTGTKYLIDTTDNLTRSLLIAGDNKEQVAFQYTLKDSAGALVSGVPVTLTATDGLWILNSIGLPVASRTIYAGSGGTISFIVMATKTGTHTLTLTSGSVSTTTKLIYGNATTDARYLALSPASASGTANAEKLPSLTATVTDRWGNPVSGVTITVVHTGVGRLAGGAKTTSYTTDSAGQYVIEATSTEAGTASVKVTGSTASGTSNQLEDLAGYVGTTELVDAITAGTSEATGTFTFAAGTSAATAAAEAASDAAAEAIDAANAATDAANLAAEAADAATVAAEEARDAADAATAAVEELATQVATLMAALKAQITTLANTVAKIAKKVKA